MAYQDSPDRRPLLYGFAALLILVAAGFLFWPRGDRSGQAGLVLTPTPEESQLASQMEAPDEELAESLDPAATGTGNEVPPEEIQAQPIREMEYDTQTDPGTMDRATTDRARQTSTQSSTSTSTRQDATTGSSGSNPPATTAQSAPRSVDLTQPGPSGRYLLNLGSFSTRENAQRRAQELQSKGVPAEISQGSKADGSPVYRVRVGYFEGHSRAKAYGQDLKSRLNIDYWISER